MQTLEKGGMTMRSHRNWLKSILAGILIGVGCILPGASGGVIAVSLGLYQPMLEGLARLDLLVLVRQQFLTVLPVFSFLKRAL